MVNGRIPSFSEFVAEKIRSGWRPPMPDASGGGGGVTANDILGQRGPVVTGPPLAPAPQSPAVTPQLYGPQSGAPQYGQGGSSSSVFSVPSGGYGALPVNPAIVGQAVGATPSPGAPTPAGMDDAARARMISDIVSSGGAGIPTAPNLYLTREMLQFMQPAGPQAGLSAPSYQYAPPAQPDVPIEEQGKDDPIYQAILNPGTTEHMAYQAQLQEGKTPDEAMATVYDFYKPAEGETWGTRYGKLMDKANVLQSKPLEFVQGREADALYQYLTWSDLTVDEAVSRGIMPTGSTQQQWESFRTDHFKSQTTGLAINEQPFPEYDNLNEQEKATFKREFMDAYEKGYSPTSKVLTNIGTYAEQPIVSPPTKEEAIASGDLPANATDDAYDTWAANWRMFEPGSKAGHEYLAGTKPWWQRGLADITQDPLSYLGLERPVGEAVVRAGERVLAEETGSIAAKTIGTALKGTGAAVQVPNKVLNELPDVIFGGVFGGLADQYRKVPKVGAALDQHVSGRAILSGAEVRDAGMETSGISDIGAPQTDIGGVPQPVPNQPLGLPSGSAGSSPMGPYPPGTAGKPTAPVAESVDYSLYPSKPIPGELVTQTPVAPGYTRLYRGEFGGEGGQFFFGSLEDVKRYGMEHGNIGDFKVVTVDVPSAQATTALSVIEAGGPEADDLAKHYGGPTNLRREKAASEYYIAPDLAAGAQPMGWTRIGNDPTTNVYTGSVLTVGPSGPIFMGSGMPQLGSGTNLSPMGPFPAMTGPYGPIPQPSVGYGTLALPATSTAPDFAVGNAGETLVLGQQPIGPSPYTGEGVLDPNAPGAIRPTTPKQRILEAAQPQFDAFGNLIRPGEVGWQPDLTTPRNLTLKPSEVPETAAAPDIGGTAAVPEPLAAAEVPAETPRATGPDTPNERIVPPVERMAQPRPANWYEPYPDGGRLIDDIYYNRDLDIGNLGDFDDVNEPKRAAFDEADQAASARIKADIDRAAQLDYNGGQAVWNNEIRPAMVNQKLAAVDHVVNDVVADYHATIGGELPEVPLTATRADMGRPRDPGDTVPFLAQEKLRTPAGNTVIPDPKVEGRFQIKGHSKDSPFYVTADANGTYTVTHKSIKGQEGLLTTGLSDNEVVDLADQTLKTARAKDVEETTSYLIERAVYRTDDGADRVLNELRLRINDPDPKIRISQQQYEDIVTLKDQFARRTGVIPIPEADRQSAWNKAKQQALDRSDTIADFDVAELVQAVSRSDAPTLEAALVEIEKRGALRKASDAIIRQVKQFFRDMFDQNLYAVNPRLRRVMGDLGPPSFPTEGPFPEGDLTQTGRPFQPKPDQTRSQWANDVLSQKNLDGEFKGYNQHQVYAQVLPQYQAKTLEARQLRAAGADPDRLSKAERRAMNKKLYPDKKSIKVTKVPEAPLFGKPVPGAAETVTRLHETPDVFEYVDTPEGRIKKEVSMNPDQRLAFLEQENGRYGNIGVTSPEEMAWSRVARERSLSIDPKLEKQLPVALDLLHALIFRLPRTLLLADPLTAWTYTMRNIMSNATMATMDQPSWLLRGDAWKAIRGAMNDTTLDQSLAADMMKGLTGGSIPQELRGSLSKMEMVMQGPRTPTARFLGETLRIPLPKAARPIDWKRSVDRGIERGMKIGAAFVPALRANVAESQTTIAREMSDYAFNHGLHFEEQQISDLLVSLRDPNGMFDRNQVYDALYYQAKDGGYMEDVARNYAERGSRSWQNLAKQSERDALERTRRIFPSNLEQTNLDHYLSYVTLFHFWPTRAAKFMLESMIRHPQYAIWWWKAHEGVARMAEEGTGMFGPDSGYPDSVKGLMRVFAGPFGMAFYANPAAMFMVTQLLPATEPKEDPQNVTKMGHYLLKIKNEWGLGPIPAIDAALNLMGVYGDNFMPDVLPSRTTDLVLAGLDAALVASGHPAHSPVWDQAMENARGTLSGMVPWTSNVPAGDASGHVTDLIGTMVLQQNPDLWARMSAVETLPDGTTRPTQDALVAQQEYDAIMDDESSDAFVKAEQAVAYGNVFTKALNIFFPLSVRSKIVSREESIQLAKSGRDKMDEYKKTNPAATYEEQLAQLTPAEQAQIDTRSMIRATPEKRDLMVGKSAQEAYGTPEQVTLSNGYNMIAYDDLKPGDVLIVGNTGYNYDTVMTMGEDQRRALADQWLMTQPNGLEDYASYTAGKKEFTASMPASAEYSDWTKFMREGEGTDEENLAANRQKLIDTSPGYRTYMDRLQDEVKNDPARYAAASVSQDAFLAASGKSGSVYEQPPGEALDISSVRYDELTGSGTGASTSGGKSSDSTYQTAAQRLEKLNKSISDYEAKMATFDAKVSTITGGVAYEDLAPMWQQALANRLEREGIKVPGKPAIVASYEDFKTSRDEKGLPSAPIDYIQWIVDNEQTLTDQMLADEAAA